MKKAARETRIVLFATLFTLSSLDGFAGDVDSRCSMAVEAVRALYVEPLALDATKISIRTEMFALQDVPERFWIVVDENRSCCQSTVPATPLIEVYLYMPEGKLSAVNASGRYFEQSTSVTGKDRDIRITASKQALISLTGWSGVDGPPTRNRDGTRLRLLFRNIEGKIDETQTFASFDAKTGALILAGVP